MDGRSGSGKGLNLHDRLPPLPGLLVSSAEQRSGSAQHTSGQVSSSGGLEGPRSYIQQSPGPSAGPFACPAASGEDRGGSGSPPGPRPSAGKDASHEQAFEKVPPRLFGSGGRSPVSRKAVPFHPRPSCHLGTRRRTPGSPTGPQSGRQSGNVHRPPSLRPPPRHADQRDHPGAPRRLLR